MNKILVPVDFSATSLNALLYTIHLFKEVSTEIVVLHTYGAHSTAFHMKSMDNILEGDAQREMDDFLNKVPKLKRDTILTPKLVKSGAVATITSMGDTGEYDLIIMGTTGASGLKKVFIGSVAGGVMSTTKAPVIVVPSGYQFSKLDTILFAVSEVPYSDDSIVEPLRMLAQLHQAKINMLHITNNEIANIDEQINPLRDMSPSVNYLFGADDINQSLKDYLAEHDNDLLCLIRSKKAFLSQLFDASVTMEQTFSCPVPLLILQN
ncbi:MAG: universal stress protein [Bacteroidota bacterium]